MTKLSSLHTALRRFRRAIAVFMSTLYLMIATVPLHATTTQLLHAGQGANRHCTGDCDRDGCSLANRLNHSCCCWKKKQQQNHPPGQSAATGSCCHSSLPADIILSVLDDTRSLQETSFSRPFETTPDRNSPILTCNCPFDPDNQAVATNNETNETLPFYFNLVIMPPDTAPFSSNPDDTLNSLPVKPPVPPPRSA